MKLKELLSGLEILSATADLETEITGISYDSRQVKPGELFAALSGYAADGHKVFLQPWPPEQRRRCSRFRRRMVHRTSRLRIHAGLWP